MKLLITGGAGFIGSHIVDAFLEKGYEVVVADNLSTGNNTGSKARYYKVDICSSLLDGVFKKENPDYVIHHAAQINVRSSLKDPVHDANINVIGSINVLECCRKYQIKKIVYSSSGGACYGEPNYLPCDEKHPIAPLSPYGASKFAAEQYFYIYKMIYGLDYVVLRYSNVYGPRQDPLGEAGVIAIFCSKSLAGENCVIFGDGNQTRDFVYVQDVADANILAVEKETLSKIFNIGAGKETSVNELFTQIKKITLGKSKAIFAPAIQGEVCKIYLDNSLAKKELGWKPNHDLSSGLRKTIEWCRAPTKI